MTKKVVNLDLINGVGLLVPANTEVFFENQVGGSACLRKSIEGIYIPLDNDYPLDEPNLYIGKRIKSLFADGSDGYLSGELIDGIQNALEQSFETREIKINKAKISESLESWVFVECSDSKYSIFNGFGNFEAILTWGNSD